tara:strand:- start:424 stop:951 length:528 start_codon:yes stop_codon:yes gene_type:complete
MDPYITEHMNTKLKEQLSHLCEKSQRGLLKPITPEVLDNLPIPNKTEYLSKLFGADITEPNNLAALHKLIAQPGVCWIKAALNGRNIIFNQNATTGVERQEMEDVCDEVITKQFLKKKEEDNEYVHKEKRIWIGSTYIMKNVMSDVVKKWHAMSKQDASDFLRLIKTYKPKENRE